MSDIYLWALWWATGKRFFLITTAGCVGWVVYMQKENEWLCFEVEGWREYHDGSGFAGKGKERKYDRYLFALQVLWVAMS